jgi:hypothetical protein
LKTDRCDGSNRTDGINRCDWTYGSNRTDRTDRCDGRVHHVNWTVLIELAKRGMRTEKAGQMHVHEARTIEAKVPGLFNRIGTHDFNETSTEEVNHHWPAPAGVAAHGFLA